MVRFQSSHHCFPSNQERWQFHHCRKLPIMFLRDRRKRVIHFGIDCSTIDINPGVVLCSLIKQVMPEGGSVSDFVREGLTVYKDSSATPSAPDLLKMLQRLFRKARRDIYIIIDGLEKYRTSRSTGWHGGNIMKYILELTTCDLYNLHVLSSSQNDDKIVKSISSEGWDVGIVDLDSTSRLDLENFISYRMERLPSIRDMPDDDREYLKSKILSKERK